MKNPKSFMSVKSSSSQSLTSLKKWRITPKGSKANKMTSSNYDQEPLSFDESPFVYYYYYNNNNENSQMLPQSDVNDDQLQQQKQQAYNNNVAGNYYYYYTIDGNLSDNNHNEFFIQPIVDQESNSLENIKNLRRF